jgi:hypothetical protein
LGAFDPTLGAFGSTLGAFDASLGAFGPLLGVIAVLRWACSASLGAFGPSLGALGPPLGAALLPLAFLLWTAYYFCMFSIDYDLNITTKCSICLILPFRPRRLLDSNIRFCIWVFSRVGLFHPHKKLSHREGDPKRWSTVLVTALGSWGKYRDKDPKG